MTEIPVEEPGSMWGVGVGDIKALAPHITVFNDDVAEPGTVFGQSQRRVLASEVQRWIDDVSAMADMRLYRRTELSEAIQPRISKAAAAVVANGAASYLVAAAFPNKAGVNDNTSYSAELWQRYESGLAALVDAIDGWLEDPPPAEPGTASSGGMIAAFPPVRIGDYGGW